MASGGALFAGGAVLGLVGVNDASHAATRDGSDASAARTKSIAGDVVASAGIATAGVGLVLLLTQASSKPMSRATMSPWASGSTAGITWRF